jgi:hypothetical protein
MKSKIFRLLIFIFIVFISDRIIGIILNNLYNLTNDYSISKLRYTLDSTNQDVLIFGSSRAMNQFDPGVIEKNLNMSTYNCGLAGQGLQLSWVQLIETLKRYKPKLVVVDISPNILLDPSSEEKLKVLLPYYKRDTAIYNLVTSYKFFEKIKLISTIYPYNSNIASIIRGCFKLNSDSLDGFVPIFRQLDTSDLHKKLDLEYISSEIPNEKFYYFEQMISLCNRENIKMIAIVSPFYKMNKNMEAMVRQIKENCYRFDNLIFLDYSRYLEITDRIDFFYDNLHLNYQGAKFYSDVFSKKLKTLL